MKRSQFIGYNLRNTFVEKSYTKCAAETIPRPDLKYKKLAYLWISSVKLFLFYANLRAIEI